MSEAFSFNDGAAYHRYMGLWSQPAGRAFLDWLEPGAGLRWLDVGCGNGAFTELILTHCAPAAVHGIDPSEQQLAYARQQPALGAAQFQLGDALALPFPAATFDIAVMPLVIFFVPDPLRGVREMHRVVQPGGIVAAYAWDVLGGGFPYRHLLAAMQQMGITVPEPPSNEASRLDRLQQLWSDGGLESPATLEITVQRTFRDFEDYWVTVLGSPSAAAKLHAMTPTERAQLKDLLHTALPSDSAGRITYDARANAIQGRVPA